MKTIRNKTALEQQIVVGTDTYYLKPYEEKPFSDGVANMFLMELGPSQLVEVVADSAISGEYGQAVDKPSTVWIANFMGDPDAPETVKVKVFDRETKRYKYIDVDNQKRVPRPVRREMGGAMEEYHTQDGLMARNKPPTVIEVPPFQRREFPAHIADWFLTRDGNIQPEQFRGQVGLSRPRSSFEPDMTWGLDDMRCYLQMVDRKANLGPNQKEIEAQHSNKQALELAIHEAKLLTMKRLHFRVAKASARLYSKNEFEEFRRAFEKPAPVVSADRAVAAVQKNLGPSSTTSSL